ncbi:uncharacterized protein OCT59_015256 [Rhizophagus irregularis]|uniref:uncharacterized protein n=1 Tax=Rhizophagus irregularis TaxID=588596 RepID=UPI003322B565|nr:hypothetical protein OCT59_015256 [Rhizophagus irregularis]
MINPILLGRPDSTTTEPPELPETFESPEPEDSEEEKSSYETTDEGGDIAELILIMSLIMSPNLKILK